jgi:hypothetical protein
MDNNSITLQHNPDVESACVTASSPLTKSTTYLSGSMRAELTATPEKAREERTPHAAVDDGRATMFRIFAAGRLIPVAVFQECWMLTRRPDGGSQLGTPFVQSLANRGIMDLRTSLGLIREKSKTSYMPLAQYKIDYGFVVRFPRATCRGWLVFPFDSVGRYTLAATVNPFNKQATAELENATKTRVIWYLANPSELVAAILRAFH